MKVIAHRGASGIAPENTMPAFELGWRCGADGVEMDLHLTKDGRIAVIHDFDTARMGDTEVVVSEAAFDELTGVDVGAWKGEEWRGTRVPELSEVLNAAPTGKELVLELKVGPEILPVLTRCLRESSVNEDDVVVISFNDSVYSVKEWLPRARAYFLNGDAKTLEEALANSAEAGMEGVDLYWELIDDSLMRKANDLDLDVYVWTVDDPEMALRMRELGVSALTTNKPAEMLEVLGKQGE